MAIAGHVSQATALKIMCSAISYPVIKAASSVSLSLMSSTR